MEVPESLPQMLYLLAYDTRKQRMTARLELGYVLRAAALTDLLLAGHLTDADGRPRVRGEARIDDPLTDELFQQLAVSPPRSWQRWVNRQARKAPRTVRDTLAAAGVIRVESYRRLGLFPANRITLRDPRMHKRLTDRVSAALSQTRPASRVEPRDAAMVALAATGEFSTVLPRPRRRESRRRIAELSEAAGPVTKALRRAIAQARSAAAGG